MSSCRAASCWTRRRTRWNRSTKRYGDIAQLSKFSGGIGVSYTRVRSRGSLIKSTNGHSNGIVPWLKTLDSSVAAVNQGGKRKGAACVYLEPWHADVEEFLELRDNTGDEARRTHNLNLANWIPDLFMQRVEADADWSLFDPRVVPELTDLFGEDFERAYAQAEGAGQGGQDDQGARAVRADDAHAGADRQRLDDLQGHLQPREQPDLAAGQRDPPVQPVHRDPRGHLGNDETAVCNLGSINLARHFDDDGLFDFDKLAETVRLAVRQLDRVIDLNFYPIETARRGNLRWRPVGLGCMGLQDVFFKLRLPFDGDEARALSARIAETIYFHALETSCELAEERGQHPSFADTRAANGELQFDAWNVVPANMPSAGTPCASASGCTACATRC
jgi:ribonucleoside-diphosphate reductase alpha chain